MTRSRLRSFLIGAGAYGAILLITQMASAGQDKGAPAAILFLGLIFGLLNSLVAAGIILIYRTSRIINFAQAAIGAAGGVFTYNLVVAQTTRLPFLLAFVAGVLLAGLIGLVIELAFVRRFFLAPRLVLTVVSIALVPALAAAANFIRFLPIFGEARDREFLEVIGAVNVPLPFASFKFQVGEYGLPFGFGHLFSIGFALIGLLGLGAFLRYTRSGVAVRAAAENSERAMLLGINVKGLSTIVWTITGMLSGLGVILTSTATGSFQGVGGTSPGALIAALAAAVIARMRSIPVAVAAAVGIHILRATADWAFLEPEQLAIFDAFLFVVILVGLLLQQRELGRVGELEASSWRATEELRPTPKEMLQIPGVRVWRWAMIIIGVSALLLFPWALPTGPTNEAGYLALVGIVILSLVVLTGWTGQVSLGQFALVGVGAVVGGALTARADISFWFALPIGALVTGALAIFIGLPALRIRGLFLAVTTYAFAFAVESNLFNERYFGWLLPESVERPTLFLLDFEDERSMYYLSLTALLIAVVVVTTLRRSRPGRIFIALRENEPNAQSFGVNLVRTRLAAFAFSGFLCGFAGVILAHHQRAVTKVTFPALESLNVFIFGVIGGIGSVAGALLGAVYFALSRIFGGNIFLGLIIGPVGLLIILYISPGGLGALAYSIRDSVLRIVAQRRQMIVPSLFADMDPLALERQLIPLAEPLPSSGLGALPLDQRYRLDSRMYKDRGRLVSKRSAAPEEADAIRAAAGTAATSPVRVGDGQAAPETAGAGKGVQK